MAPPTPPFPDAPAAQRHFLRVRQIHLTNGQWDLIAAEAQRQGVRSKTEMLRRIVDRYFTAEPEKNYVERRVDRLERHLADIAGRLGIQLETPDDPTPGSEG